MKTHQVRHRQSCAPSAHQPRPPAARSPKVRHILHGGSQVQRTQIDHVHPAAGSDPDHFLYELDDTVKAFAQLAALYGVGTNEIQALNPGKNPGALQPGERIKVPAVGPPAAESWPVESWFTMPAVVQSTTTRDVQVRWSSTAGSNRIGTLKRGAPVGALYDGVVVDLDTVQKRAELLVAELGHLGLASGRSAVGFIESENVRWTGLPETDRDLNLIARMIWGEQRGQGEAAMTAAAWVAKNRFDAGWGSYEQILAKDQFQGVVSPDAVAGLSGADFELWTKAQIIAKEVVDEKRPDPTGGALFFGNGDAMLEMMRNRTCTWGTIVGTNFHFSLGDYTAPGCPVR
jgi:hypothetical protein